MTKSDRLLNIGPKSSQWLASVGIQSEDDLRKLGAVEAYRRVKMLYPDRVTLNLLWGLQGALLGIHWNLLPQAMKDDLLRQLGDG